MSSLTRDVVTGFGPAVLGDVGYAAEQALVAAIEQALASGDPAALAQFSPAAVVAVRARHENDGTDITLGLPARQVNTFGRGVTGQQ